MVVGTEADDPDAATDEEDEEVEDEGEKHDEEEEDDDTDDEVLSRYLSRCLSHYIVYPCVGVLLTNWQLYATRQDRHRHQHTFSHCSYHTSPLDHCGQATHRGWPFLELEQFLPAVLSRSAAPTVWNSLPDNVVNSDALAPIKKRLNTHLFRCFM